ncbi:MAG: ABC transporter permease [Coriobacteriaceae bacterium]|nr:ABC transporter permease [Coriobacteriaceae bacterium]
MNLPFNPRKRRQAPGGANRHNTSEHAGARGPHPANATAPGTAPTSTPQPACATTPGTSPAKPPRGIFTRFALRSLKQNRTRTFVSIIGIALSCALITAIFTSVSTLYSGLLTAELARDGSWQVALINLDQAGLERTAKDDRIEQSYILNYAGAALMPEGHGDYWGRYLTVQEWPQESEVGTLRPLPLIAEGREPNAPGEIALPLELKGTTTNQQDPRATSMPTTGKDTDAPCATWENGLEIGSHIALPLGQRTYVDPETGSEYPCLADESLYTASSPKGDVICEYLGNIQPARELKVVGFYEESPTRSTGAWQNSAGYLGFSAPGDLPVQSTDVYMSTNLTSLAGINKIVKDYTDLDHATFNGGGNRGGGEQMKQQTSAYTHNSLLRYQGMTDDRAIWGTLYTLAAILAGVVIVASVSLIYNSFAITVAERTRQFGLLASLGASKAQLRRTVFAEALMLAVIGIPAGLLLGLAGTFVVFNIAGEGIGLLIDAEVFEVLGLTSIVVNPSALAVCALLALATVLISAAVPAWRASRVSAIGAIRQARDVRLSRRERRAAKRAERRAGAHARTVAPPRPARVQALDNLRLRTLGVPGLMAHRNLTRASSKGRVAVASLAVSVALIIISGSIAHYMGYLAERSNTRAHDIEISTSRTLGETETTHDGIENIQAVYDKLSATPNTTAAGFLIHNTLCASYSPGMLDAKELKTSAEMYDMPEYGIAPDGTAYAPVSLLFVDEATWHELIESNNLDASKLDDPSNPVALGLNNVKANDGERYAVRDMFHGTGTATLFTHIATPAENMLKSVSVDESGAPVAVFEGYGSDEQMEFDEYGQPIYHTTNEPLKSVVRSSRELAVGATITEFGGALKAFTTAWPTLVLPAEALPTLAAGVDDLQSETYAGELAMPFAFHQGESSQSDIHVALSFDSSDPRKSEAAMQEIRESELTGGPWGNTYLINNAEDARQARLVYEAIQLFINCFIAITSAIAVANVFNTLTNSIILRRREFAMLKSAGMGNRAFLKMITLECLSYAWRGLAIGLVLGAGVTFLVWQAMRASFYGIDLMLPFGWVLAAFGLVIGVLALSTWYALRKSSAASIVQTLREDTI